MTQQTKSPKFSPEVRERAVRMVVDHAGDYPSQWAAIASIAAKIGCTTQTLSNWVKQAERDSGKRAGLTTDERERLKALERENRELRQANEILRKASAYFAQAELEPPANPGRFTAFAAKQYVDAPVAIALTRLRYLLDPLPQAGLRRSAGLVVVARRVEPEGAACAADAHLPDCANVVDQFPLPRRPHSLPLMTSCSISLSKERPATIRFSRPLSSSSWRKRLISDGINPPYFFFQA